MSSQHLWFYRDQLFRVVQESLEASLVICKTELYEFTVAKMFDIFVQILPTAFVLNTGYWLYFNTAKRQSLCICGQYGMECRHCKNLTHWIDLESITNDNSLSLSNRLGNLLIMDSMIEVTPIMVGQLGYSLNIKLTFQYRKIQRGRPKNKKIEDFNSNLPFQVAICSRFNLQREYYPALRSLCFQPSPFLYSTYGSVFQWLLRARDPLIAFNNGISHFLVTYERMPHFTVVLQQVNVPTYQATRQCVIPVVLTLPSNPNNPAVKNNFASKSTQTDPMRRGVEVWRFRETFENGETMWANCPTMSPCDTPSTSGCILPNLAAATDLDDSKNPAAAQKRKAKKFALKAIEAPPNSDPGPSCSYASVVRTPKPALDFSNDFENFPKLEVKNDDIQWIDDFPGLFAGLPSVKKEQIEEDFEIAEEFIREEKARWAKGEI